MKLFTATNKVIEYDGNRTTEDMLKFLNEKCNAFRSMNGSIDKYAGRIKSFDDLAKQFMKSDQETRKQLIKIAKMQLVLQNTIYSKYYIKVMEKSLDDEEYPQREQKRLKQVLDEETVEKKQLENFKTRMNILDAFVEVPKISHGEL